METISKTTVLALMAGFVAGCNTPGKAQKEANEAVQAAQDKAGEAQREADQKKMAAQAEAEQKQREANLSLAAAVAEYRGHFREVISDIDKRTADLNAKNVTANAKNKKANEETIESLTTKRRILEGDLKMIDQVTAESWSQRKELFDKDLQEARAALSRGMGKI